MSEHIDGTPHHWDLWQFVNQVYSGTAFLQTDALIICHKCGAWKVVPQDSYNPTTRAIAQEKT